nr:uncharacterized protein LOC122269890 [Parasteatoda tepidariorum]
MNEKLKSIQRIPLLTITKAYSTVSSEAIQILAGIVPIHLKILEDIIIKRMRWGWRTDDLVHVFPECSTQNINFDTPAPLHPSKYRSLPWGYDFPKDQGLEIFTDGSRMETGNDNIFRTAFAFVVYFNGVKTHQVSTRVEDNTNIFIAELLAIKSALQWLQNNNITEATIYSDSLSSLQALADPQPTSDIIETTKLLWRQNIKLNWVKAHVGIQGNEEADEAAKMAIGLDTVELQGLRTPKQVKSKLRDSILIKWAEEWRNCPKGRQTYDLIKTPSTKRLLTNFYLNQFITGHGVFGVYQKRFFNKSGICQYCTEEQTIHHLLFDCARFRALRGDIFTNKTEHQIFSSNDCKNIVKEIIRVTLEDLLKINQV